MATELGVATRDGDVVKENIGVRMPARSRDIGVQQEPSAGIRPSPHDQERRPGRKGTNGILLFSGDLAIEGRELLFEILAVVRRCVSEAGIVGASCTVPAVIVPIVGTNHREPPKLLLASQRIGLCTLFG